MRARARIRRLAAAGVVILFFGLVRPEESPPMAVVAALAIGFYACASENFEPLQGPKREDPVGPPEVKCSGIGISRWAAEDFQKREKGLGSCSYQGPGEEKVC